MFVTSCREGKALMRSNIVRSPHASSFFSTSYLKTNTYAHIKNKFSLVNDKLYGNDYSGRNRKKRREKCVGAKDEKERTYTKITGSHQRHQGRWSEKKSQMKDTMSTACLSVNDPFFPVTLFEEKKRLEPKEPSLIKDDPSKRCERNKKTQIIMMMIIMKREETQKTTTKEVFRHNQKFGSWGYSFLIFLSSHLICFSCPREKLRQTEKKAGGRSIIGT